MVLCTTNVDYQRLIVLTFMIWYALTGHQHNRLLNVSPTYALFVGLN
jgi:hypothetical protein